jgi:hypothetical protein
MKVADPLYLSLWFSSSDIEEVLALTLSALRQFPFSAQHPGVSYLAVHPVSWGEATVLEQRFNPGVNPEQAVLLASDLLHEDYAYVFEATWDLWVPDKDQKEWTIKPSLVKFLVHGANFEDGAAEQDGQIQVDLGFDTPFIQEEVSLTPVSEEKIKANLKKLIDFAVKAEKATSASRRLLWSESEEADLAQRLIARLQ